MKCLWFPIHAVFSLSPFSSIIFLRPIFYVDIRRKGSEYCFCAFLAILIPLKAPYSISMPIVESPLGPKAARAAGGRGRGRGNGSRKREQEKERENRDH